MRRKSVFSTLVGIAVLYFALSNLNINEYIGQYLDTKIKSDEVSIPLNDAKNTIDSITDPTDENYNPDAAEVKNRIETVGNGIGNFFTNILGRAENSNTTDTASAATKSDTTTINNDLEAVKLLRVVDGDTIVVEVDDAEMTVRFIGIDTPESVNPDESKNTEYGTYASDYTKSLLNGVETVYLQYDEEKEDKYGRALAYVWLEDNVDVKDSEDISAYMLNAILVEDGYAYDKVYEPNDMYASYFSEYKAAARDALTGLWEYPEFALLWD